MPLVARPVITLPFRRDDTGLEQPSVPAVVWVSRAAAAGLYTMAVNVALGVSMLIDPVLRGLPIGLAPAQTQSSAYHWAGQQA